MRLPWILFFCLIFAGILPAQQYNFQNYSVADGLAQSQVFALCEDSRGYLWMGTRGGGLSRFDGNEFTNFTVDNGLVNDYVLTIATDKKGDIWIGTDEGACVFNGINFTTVKLPGTPHKVRAIVCGSDGRTWIGTEDTGL
ncbi:MAG: hypothetical protein IPI10_18250, partial [Bacteroidetes bacterium]|nr:hypothetical protein [Bacteroidota bacterium]